jgi:hypothetical protein
VNASKRLTAGEPVEPIDAERKLPKGKGALR